MRRRFQCRCNIFFSWFLWRNSGCPFELKVKNPYLGKEILAHGSGLYQCRTNQIDSFTIDTRGFSSKLFDVVVAGPNDTAVPVRCYQQKDGNLLAQFTAPVSGPFLLLLLFFCSQHFPRPSVHSFLTICGPPFAQARTRSTSSTTASRCEDRRSPASRSTSTRSSSTRCAPPASPPSTSPSTSRVGSVSRYQL